MELLVALSVSGRTKDLLPFVQLTVARRPLTRAEVSSWSYHGNVLKQYTNVE